MTIIYIVLYYVKISLGVLFVYDMRFWWTVIKRQTL